MQSAFTFSKEERLCSKSIISKLFDKGNRGFSRFPFRFSWVETSFESPYPVQVLITVPRRNFPRAHQRNRIKRQLRELYRLHKSQLYLALNDKNRKFALMLAYQGKEPLKIQELTPLFRSCINVLKNELPKADPVAVHRPDQNL